MYDLLKTYQDRAEKAERELAEIKASVVTKERDTLFPQEEPTGPIHPDPLAEICIAVDQLKDAVLGRLSGVESTVSSMQHWRPGWVDEVLALGQRVIKLEAKVVKLEDFRTTMLESCKDCARLQALGGE